MWRFRCSVNLWKPCLLWGRNFRPTRFWSPPWQIPLMVICLSVCIHGECPEFCTSQLSRAVHTWRFIAVFFPASHCQGAESKTSRFKWLYLKKSHYDSVTQVYADLYLNLHLCCSSRLCDMCYYRNKEKGSILFLLLLQWELSAALSVKWLPWHRRDVFFFFPIEVLPSSNIREIQHRK